MTSEQLQVFLDVAKTLSISKTAESLFLSRSTISRQIAAIEDSIGAPLFIRDKKNGLRLTALGNVLYKEGQSISMQLIEVNERLSQMDRFIRERLSLAMHPLENKDVLQAWEQFRKENPRYSFSLVHQDQSDIVNSVEQGTTDIGIVFSFELIGRRNDFQELFLCTGDFCVCAGPQNPLNEKTYITPEELRRHRILFPSINSMLFLQSRDREKHLKNEYGHPQMLNLQLDEELALIDSNNDFVIALPRLFAENLIPDRFCLEVQGMDTTFAQVAIWNPETRTKPMKAFLEKLLTIYPFPYDKVRSYIDL